MSARRETSEDYARPYRPRALAAANAAGRALERVGLRTRLDEASLLAAARRATGLEGFASLDFLPALRRLADALEREARLHPLGRVIARAGLVRSLTNRLRAEWLRDLHGDIDATPVEAPVFIAGLQRTGTTVLHRLLALDPQLRPLPSWEALNPAPGVDPRHPTRAVSRVPPGSTWPVAGDPRPRFAEWAERSLQYMAPDFFAIHPVEAHSPEEDVLLLDLCFEGTTAEASQHVPSFSAWLEGQDPTGAYRDFRRWIQLLLWQRPGRWLGKTPHHMECLDALFGVFPDARILQTHRDPLVVLPSFCSMVSHARGVFSDHVDPAEVGRHWARKQLRMVTRAAETRDRVGADAFLDVHYRDLVADPLKQVRRAYDFLGIELATPVERRMRDWVARNPQHRHGRHAYRLEAFGLERALLERDLAEYRERFGVAVEDART